MKLLKRDLFSRFVHGKYFIITLRQNVPDFNRVTPGKKGSVHSCVGGRNNGINVIKRWIYNVLRAKTNFSFV